MTRVGSSDVVFNRSSLLILDGFAKNKFSKVAWGVKDSIYTLHPYHFKLLCPSSIKESAAESLSKYLKLCGVCDYFCESLPTD